MNLRSTLPRHWCAPLHLHCQKITRVWTQQQTLAPSILRVHRFGRWVVTHSQVDVDLYDHLPAVPTVEPLFWSLGQFTLWRFSQTFGSFPIAIPSYKNGLLPNNFVFCLPDKRSLSNTNSEFEMRPKQQNPAIPDH